MAIQHLICGMEKVRKLTPEERRKEMDKELRELEMERRRRVALEEEEINKEAAELKRQQQKDEENRKQEAKQRQEEEEKQLKRERLRWREVMKVEELPITEPKSTPGEGKREQQRRPKIKEQRRETLINNWVGEEKRGKTCKNKVYPTNSTLCPSAETLSLRSDTAPKSSKPLQWLKDTLGFGTRCEKINTEVKKKKQAQADQKLEARRLKESYRKLEACKDSRLYHLPQQVHGYNLSRNKILKKSLLSVPRR